MTDKTKKEEQPFDTAQGELKALQLKCEEYLNGWKRERADFLNYKKDEMERIGELAKYANTEIILKIIPILDNIYLAESHVPPELEKHDWIKGFNQIKNQLADFLGKEGIEPIDVLGKSFDANTMESVGTEEAKPAFVKDFGEAREGIVIEEVQKGYTMHEKLIRVARVKISK